jgi:hypothetical protein
MVFKREFMTYMAICPWYSLPFSSLNILPSAATEHLKKY